MSDTIRLIAEFFAACVGTIAFALLFQVPRQLWRILWQRKAR